MGRRGPLPEPHALKLLKGTARADRLGRGTDDRPIRGRPFPAPVYLSEAARAEWLRLEKVLRLQGLLREEYLAQYEAYCSAVGSARDAEQLLATANKPSQRLLWSGLARKAWAQVQRLGADFGLNPAARVRAGIDLPVPKTKTHRNPFASIG